MAAAPQQGYRPKKTHKSKKRQDLSSYAAATLGAGNMKQAVQCPKGEDLNEWLAVNTLDLFNEASLLYGIITEYCTKTTCPLMSAGPKYEYLWADGVKVRKPIKCTAPEYVDYLFSWIEEQINDERIFPIEQGAQFPKNFRRLVRTILKRLFRVYGHIYHSHVAKFTEMQAQAHLNTCFKHYVYFVKEFQLVDDRELAPLKDFIDQVFNRGGGAAKYKPKYDYGGGGSAAGGAPA